jgi:aminoglycoside phosphotransferase (APT) family kinase protein
VYNISFEDGPDIIIRIAFNFEDTERSRAAVQAKMEQETATIQLVKATVPGVPVPEIFYTDPRPSNILGAPYMLMEKLPGKHTDTMD